jgi:triacylglycerol lipase
MLLLIKILLFLLLSYTNTYSYSLKDMLLVKGRLCKICYSKKANFNIKKNKLLSIYNNYMYINNTKTNNYFYIFYNNSSMDICFKGTSNIKDVYTNLNICPKSFINKDIKIHSGYLYKYLSLRNVLIENINIIRNNHDIKEITFNGHSSGGAIANIAALDLSYLYKDVCINSITFGSPKIGNKHFIEEYNKNIKNSIRVVNNNDIIQYLPPFIYKHNHKPLVINTTNKIKTFNIYTYFKYIHQISTYIKKL